ncbi:hypothetical protein PR048_033415 [Dryococelus australis]|uniref:Uncharacterized protein n=1 Tax=Dryococelus australis TaxID=614101 RepID=A0ABQ9G1H1_9NEOP|nr:hypothetical protein PR048_033415 [Dryococelus australis]
MPWKGKRVWGGKGGVLDIRAAARHYESRCTASGLTSACTSLPPLPTIVLSRSRISNLVVGVCGCGPRCALCARLLCFPVEAAGWPEARQEKEIEDGLKKGRQFARAVANLRGFSTRVDFNVLNATLAERPPDHTPSNTESGHERDCNNTSRKTVVETPSTDHGSICLKAGNTATDKDQAKKQKRKNRQRECRHHSGKKYVREKERERERESWHFRGGGNQEIPEKTHRPEESSSTIPTCGNPGVTRSGIEPSPWWEASRLTAQPPRPPSLCQMMLLVGGFSRGSPVTPALEFQRCSILKSFHRHRLSRDSPVGYNRLILNAVKYRVVSGVVWTNRTRVSSNADTNRTSVLAVVDPLVHTVFDTSWRTQAQSSPSTVTADHQCAVSIDISVHQTAKSSLQVIELHLTILSAPSAATRKRSKMAVRSFELGRTKHTPDRARSLGRVDPERSARPTKLRFPFPRANFVLPVPLATISRPAQTHKQWLRLTEYWILIVAAAH